jgi:hypothetical protein
MARFSLFAALLALWDLCAGQEPERAKLPRAHVLVHKGLEAAATNHYLVQVRRKSRKFSELIMHTISTGL